MVREAYAASVPGKIKPLGGVYNGIARWGGTPEDDFVPVGPDCPQCGEKVHEEIY